MEIKALSLTIEQVCLASEASDFSVISVTAWIGAHYFSVKSKIKWNK